jgi:hypothetical protein
VKYPEHPFGLEVHAESFASRLVTDLLAAFEKDAGGGGYPTPGETAEFRECWQARVQALLLEHGDDPEVFVVRAVARKPMPA